MFWAKIIEMTQENQDLPTFACKLLECIKGLKEISQLSLAETTPT